MHVEVILHPLWKPGEMVDGTVPAVLFAFVS